jgi:plasmid stabilization system protein ParE
VKIRLVGPARRQADRIDRWWRENRPAARDLFAREMAEARALLVSTPDAGAPFTERQGVVVRRLLLPRTRYHLYYEVNRESEAVMVLAVWGAPRGGAPKL